MRGTVLAPVPVYLRKEEQTLCMNADSTLGIA